MNRYQKQTAQRAARRRAKMRRLKEKGWTLEKIGRAFGGISKQRVAAILSGGSGMR